MAPPLLIFTDMKLHFGLKVIPAAATVVLLLLVLSNALVSPDEVGATRTGVGSRRLAGVSTKGKGPVPGPPSPGHNHASSPKPRSPNSMH